MTLNSASFPTCFGPENISEKLRIWVEQHGITTPHIQPGHPRQSTYVARHNGTARLDWTAQYSIKSVEEAQDQANQWRRTYKNDRPNMSVGGITPAMKLKWPHAFYRHAPLKRGRFPQILHFQKL